MVHPRLQKSIFKSVIKPFPRQFTFEAKQAKRNQSPQTAPPLPERSTIHGPATQKEPNVGATSTARAVDSLLASAKQKLESGEAQIRSAADDMIAAANDGATQRAIAAAVGLSVSWVNRIMKWRRDGGEGTPFGPSSRAARRRRSVSSTEQGPVHLPLDHAAVAAFVQGEAGGMPLAMIRLSRTEQELVGSLREHWSRASTAARRTFLNAIVKEIAEL